jgi:HEAT repeat protein
VCLILTRTSFAAERIQIEFCENNNREAHETREVTDLLAAFGNSAGPLVLPAIRDALRDPRDPVRAAAARALRLAPATEMERLLAETLTSDRSPSVRLAAMFAAGFRHPMGPLLGEALVRAARTDPFEYVRSDALTLLRQNHADVPRAAETLAWVAEHDDKPGVRRLAREALASISALLAKWRPAGAVEAESGVLRWPR